MKKIGIIILNYNGTNDTIECIKSILRNDDMKYMLKLVLVDNNSSSNELINLKKFINSVGLIKNQSIVLLENSDNLGFSKANNIGIKYLENTDKCNYYMLLNNDTIVLEKSITNLVDSMENSESDASSGLILDHDTQRLIWYSGGQVSRLKAKGIHFNYGKSIKDLRLTSGITRFLSGCFVVFKRETLLSIGYLNENYFFGSEEYDWSLKLSKFGYKMWFCKSSVIHHKVKIQEGNGASHDIKKPIYVYNSLRNKYIISKLNLSKITFKFWYIVFKIHMMRLKTKLTARYSKRQIKVIFDSFKSYKSNLFIDKYEFEEVFKDIMEAE